MGTANAPSTAQAEALLVHGTAHTGTAHASPALCLNRPHRSRLKLAYNIKRH